VLDWALVLAQALSLEQVPELSLALVPESALALVWVAELPVKSGFDTQALELGSAVLQQLPE